MADPHPSADASIAPATSLTPTATSQTLADAAPSEERSAAATPWDWRPASASVVASSVSLLELRGPDSLRFLHGQTSQAIELARPGQWLSTCCITPTARLRALAEVLVTQDGAWLVIREGEGAGVRQALDRVLFPADAVELGPLSEGVLLEPVPGAGDAVQAASSGTAPEAAGSAESGLPDWRPLEGGQGFWLGDALVLVGSDADAAAPGGLEPAAQVLLARPRLEAERRERWRIQQGWPACPAEVNEDTNPFELGLAPRVSLSKGCYVGQETLAKLATYDGVRRQLRRWFVPGAEGPSPGAPLRAGEERAGVVTSALDLADGSGWIGLALVRRSALDAATLVAEREGAEPLTLQLSLPEAFVAPPVGAGGAGRPAG
ncbi:folate-binding protein YgfZ [Synechococcus sp. CBW1004]|uniref:CAF17-like 4Fe-4S cluster assembly/insertion protein YgfZ n=1 Tax=Synechococcus sp. CBW1004 TaxID=1353136 RepID=UPI0018CCEA15|nr:folate-binding protein [Synechococcus sp. CBW1004]QPN64750.1 folate-binding protein [Synechococcus sp. CBW1004]